MIPTEREGIDGYLFRVDERLFLLD